MSTEGISLNIVENATSDKLTKGDLKKPGQGLKEDRIRKEGKIKLSKAETYGLADFHGKETS